MARGSSGDLGTRDGAASLGVRSITWMTGAEAGASRVVRVQGVEDQPRGGAPPKSLKSSTAWPGHPLFDVREQVL
jgi:hypothetical protein